MEFLAVVFGVGSIGPLEAIWLLAIVVAFLRGFFKSWDRRW